VFSNSNHFCLAERQKKVELARIVSRKKWWKRREISEIQIKIFMISKEVDENEIKNMICRNGGGIGIF
jgi:hypothetical protein